MDKQDNVGTRPGDAERSHEFGAAAPWRGGRMSRQRKKGCCGVRTWYWYRARSV